MHKVQAWERLQDPEYCSKLTTQGFHDLLISAGYTEEVAQKATSERISKKLDAGNKI